MLALAPMATAATAGIYGGGKFYTMSPSTTSSIRDAGWTTLFLFTIHIRPNGDFYYNDTLIATNGNYVGDPAWRSRLDAVRAAPSSVYRIELCIGSWGSGSFQAIKDRIAADGTGSNTILYRNMLAMKNALGIDAVQYDDELTYDANSAVAYGNMLANMGLKVTLCPYTNSSFWKSVLTQLGSKVDAIYLQCYDGGAGNDPAAWSAYLGRKVIPGYWVHTGDGPSSATSLANFSAKMLSWRNSAGVNGGFCWMADDIGPYGMNEYAEAIHRNLNMVNETYIVANRKSDHILRPENAGTANNTPLVQATAYVGDNVRWTNTNLGNGQHKLVGVGSGRTLSADTTTDNTAVKLYDYFGGDQQKFTMDYKSDGYYSCIFVHNGKAMTVQGGSTAANAAIVQSPYNGTGAAQWMFRDDY